MDQCYYKAGSAPNRTATGTKDGSNGDGDKVKCSSFDSFSGVPARTVEEGCGGQTLLYALNHWAERCWNNYQSNEWALTGSGGAPVPRYVPTL